MNLKKCIKWFDFTHKNHKQSETAYTLNRPRKPAPIHFAEESLVEIFEFCTRKELCNSHLACYRFSRIIEDSVKVCHCIKQLKILDKTPSEPQVLLLVRSAKNAAYKYRPLPVYYEMTHIFLASIPKFARFREVHVEIDSYDRLPQYIKQFVVDSKHSFKGAVLSVCNNSAVFMTTKLFHGTTFDECSQMHLDLRTAVMKYEGCEAQKIPYDLLWYDYEQGRQEVVEWLSSKPAIEKFLTMLVSKAPTKFIEQIVERFLSDNLACKFFVKIGVICGQPLALFRAENDTTNEELVLEEMSDPAMIKTCLYLYSLVRRKKI